MRKERKFDIGNAKADLFKFYCAISGTVITKMEVHDTFTRFYFLANDIDLMDATNFCEQYIKKAAGTETGNENRSVTDYSNYYVITLTNMLYITYNVINKRESER